MSNDSPQLPQPSFPQRLLFNKPRPAAATALSPLQRHLLRRKPRIKASRRTNLHGKGEFFMYDYIRPAKGDDRGAWHDKKAQQVVKEYERLSRLEKAAAAGSKAAQRLYQKVMGGKGG